MARPRGFDDAAVVDKAMEAFWTHGYANTSPALLAEATGVAKGSLYNAFHSKRALFELALARYDVLGAEFAANFLAEPGTARERIRAFLLHLVDTDLADAEPRGCLALNTAVELAGGDPDIARVVRTIQQHTIDIVAARIDRGRRDGDVGADVDPRAAAEYIMTVISGLRVMVKAHDGPTLHRIIDSAVTAI